MIEFKSTKHITRVGEDTMVVLVVQHQQRGIPVQNHFETLAKP